MLEFAMRKHEVGFFRRMIVVGIPDVRSHQGDAEPQIVSVLEAARAKDHRVGVTVTEIAAGRRGGI